MAHSFHLHDAPGLRRITFRRSLSELSGPWLAVLGLTLWIGVVTSGELSEWYAQVWAPAVFGVGVAMTIIGSFNQHVIEVTDVAVEMYSTPLPSLSGHVVMRRDQVRAFMLDFETRDDSKRVRNIGDVFQRMVNSVTQKHTWGLGMLHLDGSVEPIVAHLADHELAVQLRDYLEGQAGTVDSV